MNTLFCRKALIAIFLLYTLSAVYAVGQGYLTASGNPSFAVNIPVENGFINVSNGNLHMEFPLATHTQRGALTLNERLVYDSKIWMIAQNGGLYWSPTSIPNSAGGWRFVTGAETGALQYNLVSSTSTPCALSRFSTGTISNEISTLQWTDPTGTAHIFNGTSHLRVIHCYRTYSVTRTISPGYATDSTGYYVSGDAHGNPVITDSSGTQVYPQVTDRFGNYWSSDTNGNLIDDVGRTPVIVTQNGNETYYDVLAANGPISNNGTRVRFTVTTAPITVNTQFHDPQVTEWNGTLNPIQSIQLPDGTSYTFTYDAQVFSGDAVAHYGEITSVTLPTGGRVGYGWANYQDSYFNKNRWLYTYRRGIDLPTVFSPKVDSFCSTGGTGCVEEVNVHRPSGDETVYQLTLNNGAWNTKTVSYSGSATSGTPLLQTDALYDFSHTCTAPNCTGAQYITKSTSTVTFSDTGQQSQTQTLYTQPQLGKPSAVKEWDYYVNAGLSGPPSSTPTRETDYVYTGFDIQSVTVLDSSGTPAGQTTYGYTSTATATSGVPDHNASLAKGPYLQTVSHWLKTGSPSNVTYALDDTGMNQSTTDAKSNPPTTFSYQCANTLPLTVTNALGQATTYAYDCNSAEITSVKDPNDSAAGRTGTTYTYEAIAGRLQSVGYPDGGMTSYSYPSSTELDVTTLASPDPPIVTETILDSYGRQYQQARNGVTSEVSYDQNGRVNCVTNQHSSFSGPTDGNSCYTVYDGLNRPLQRRNSDGSSTAAWAYTGNVATSYDETGRRWKRTTDSFGHLTQVLEPAPSDGTTTTCGPQGCISNPGATFITNYTYDGLGNLQNIAQLGVSGDTPKYRSFTYDSMSRLLCASAPENSQATCPATAGSVLPSAATTYSYDPNGNVKTRTDANGVTLIFAYDALDRRTTQYTADGSINDHYYYDNQWFTAANSIGRLTVADHSGIAGNGFWYDPMGRVVHTTYSTPTSGGFASGMSIAYDLAGQATKMFYPDGRTVTQTWDASGQLAKVSAPASGGKAAFDYLSGPAANGGVLYTPVGAPQTMYMGTTLTATFGYNSRLQPCQVQVGSNTWQNNGLSASLLSKQYFYASPAESPCGSSAYNNGNLYSVVDNKNVGLTQNFGYDSLNRLNTASRSDGGYNFSYRNDSFGNVVPQDNLHAAINYSINQSTNQLQRNVSDFHYDAVGNLTSAADAVPNNYAYNALGQMTSINSNQVAQYMFNGMDERAYKVTPAGWINYVYLNGSLMAEQTSDGAWTDYIHANGTVVAKVDSSDVRVHLSGYNQTAGDPLRWDAGGLPVPNSYTVKAGDRLNFRTYVRNANAGISIGFTDRSNTDWYCGVDQHGDCLGNESTFNAWVDRSVDFGSIAAGKTIGYMMIENRQGSPAGQFDVLLADMSIVSSDGTVTPMLGRVPFGACVTGGAYTGTTSNLSCVSEKVVSTTDFAGPPQTTTYFVSDQVGTTQLELTSGGWPIWQGQFTPYGEELDTQPTNNTLKFAGLERDTETAASVNSVLDHTQFRQLSSAYARWLSPDPYDGSMDLSNPQTLNRYSYVIGKPLAFRDPTGLEGGAPCVDLITCAIDVGIVIYDLSSLFGGSGPAFPGTTKPRPNAQPWDEYGVHLYKTNIADILGLPNTTCEFGVCGNSFGPRDHGHCTPWLGVGCRKASSIGNLFDLTKAYTVSVIVPLFYGLGPAGTVTYLPSQQMWCGGGGIGASIGHSISGGPVVVDAGKARDIIGGASVSGGYGWTPFRGVQGSWNASGATSGPSFGIPGGSAAATYSWCSGGPGK